MSKNFSQFLAGPFVGWTIDRVSTWVRTISGVGAQPIRFVSATD